MATHRIPILGWPTILDTSGNVYFEPFDIHATNDVWKRLVLVFNHSTGTRIGVQGGFTVPKNYVSAPKIVVVWTTVAITGVAVWDFDYRAVGGDDLESLDQIGTQESLTVSDTAPSTALERMEASLSLIAGNLAVDDEVEFGFFFDDTDVNNTLGQKALIFSLLFEYQDA